MIQRLSRFCTYIFDSISQPYTYYACMLSSVLSILAYRVKLWGKRNVWSARPAQGLTEYGLILVLIMVVCVVIIGTTGKTISEVWYNKLILRMP